MYISGTQKSYGTYAAYQAQLAARSKEQKPSPADFFSKVEADGSGGVDQSEFEKLAGKISEKSGQTINVEEQFAQYDANGDGSLSDDELKSFMDANKPTDDRMAQAGGADRHMGPPPPPPSDGSGGTDSSSNTFEDFLSQLEQSADESSANNYLALLQSLQDALFSKDDEQSSSSNASSYLSDFSQTLKSAADYSSIGIET